MSLDPRRLLVLHAVHRAGGVLAAAQRLHLTPSGVSQHLSKLEAETGLALIDRSQLGGGRSVTLTALGRALALHAEALAGALADAEQTLESLQGTASGPVVVGAFPTAIRQLVAPAVATLSSSHPGLRPHVVEASEPAALQDLSAGRLDVAVLERDGDADDRSLVGVAESPLLRDPYRIVVPLGWSSSAGIVDILSGPWIAAPTGSAARSALDRLMHAHGEPAGPVVHECLEFPAALALVGAGLGAALVPDLALTQTPHDGVRVHSGPLDPGARVLTVAHRAGRNEPTPAVNILVAELRRQAGSDS